jgi:hypothetical protein
MCRHIGQSCSQQSCPASITINDRDKIEDNIKKPQMIRERKFFFIRMGLLYDFDFKKAIETAGKRE